MNNGVVLSTYLKKANENYPGLFTDAVIFLVFITVFSLHYFNQNFIFQGDVLLNLYMRTYHSLFSAGFDPYAWGYLGWYPISGTLFPLNIITHSLTSLFGDTPAAALKLTQINAAVSLFLLGYFTYILMRFLEKSRGGALVAAMIISFTGFHVQAGFRELDLFYLHSFMFAPLTIIFLIKANRASGFAIVKPTLLAGLTVGLSLLGGGNSPMFFFIPVFLFTYTVGRPIKELFSGRLFIKSAVVTGIALTVAMIVGFAMVLPSLKYMSLSSRSLFVEDGIIQTFDLSQNLLTVFFREWWNKGYYEHEVDCFLGLPALILSFLGLSTINKKRPGSLLMLIAAVIAIFSIYIAFMPEFIQTLFTFVLLKLSIRFPFRFFMVLLLAVSFFAASGFDLLKENLKELRQKKLYLIVLTIIVLAYSFIGITYFQNDILISARRSSFVAVIIVTIIFYITFLLLSLSKHKELCKFLSALTVFLIFIFYFSAGADYPTRDKRAAGYPRLYPATVEESINHFFYTPTNFWQEYDNDRERPFRIFDRGLELRKNLWAPIAKLDIAFEPYNDPATSMALRKYSEIIFKPKFKPFSPLVDLYNIKHMIYREFKDYKQVSSRIYTNKSVFDRFFVTHGVNSFSSEDSLFAGLKDATSAELRDYIFLTSLDDKEGRSLTGFTGPYEE
ncbi:MAG: hypothetical protein V3T30_05110, partial [Thermodesulfobacteriota bacterium]